VKIGNGWKNELATMQNLIEAQNKGIEKEMTPSGPNGQMVTFEQLLKERIEVLRAQKNDPASDGAGRSAA
jgi:hypothetical protein